MEKCKNCKNLKYKDDGRERYAWCPLIGDNPNLEFDRFCGGYKTMSQGDKIRNMTDEELVKLLIGSCSESMGMEHCPHDDEFLSAKDLKKSCSNCAMEWLKSEVGCE